MRILITGAAGFIGSSLAKRAVAEGHSVIGVDNLITGNRENLAAIDAAIDFRVADIRNREQMQELCRGVEIIFHEAALPSVPKSVLDPLTSHEHNVEGTVSVLLAAKEQKVRRVVYAASSSAYGESPTLPKHEAMIPAPISPYAVQKLTGEYYMQSFQRVYGMETVCLRYFNVFGPFQAADSPYSGVLAKFITSLLQGEAPTIFGDGQQSRDFTYIDNVVDANFLAATAPADVVSGKVYNLACGERHSLLDTFRILAEMTGFAGAPVFGAARNGDILHSLADISLIAREMGYQPQVNFEEGLRRTVAWYAEALKMQTPLSI
ncbi:MULTISPECIES: SDR family oxidoreductase [Acidobacterium]|uniref:Exopolysaccharide biosynthesis protein n=1 Tax=Acidobacterium capsulatum (strain ATCC 51196 / DSM 11244 / BCRC 80197 / JCM 7670 / NBRC 15755 / NCIMB 13165 / 161) TaxID=240015 RepID=C1F6I9_ACIC5|nr:MULTISPECIES: SDR family oxidoreductase [Acidobacterium]ACO32443.1 exopolysaccharide biosynthesis protein [Acidobacterium capsulatum ATCC 51196]HCT60878.1 LPS biosynthesis protein WbpP [Acidobacterium sp.]